MEEFSIPLLITAVVIIISIIFIIQWVTKMKPKLPTPPGPPVKDIRSGHNHDIENCGGLIHYLENIHHEYGPVVEFYMGPNQVISIASAELFENVSKESERPLWFMEPWAPLFGTNSVNLTNGVEGRHRAALYTRCLSGTGLKQYFSTFNTIAGDVAKTWLAYSQKNEEIQLLYSVKSYVLQSLVQCCFGSYFDKPENAADLQSLMDMTWDHFSASLTRAPREGYTREKELFEKSIKGLRQQLMRSVKDRKNSKYPEEINLFIDLPLANDDNDEKKLDDLVTILFAGIHNTSLTLMWCIYFLARHPDIQDKVYKELMEELVEDNVNEQNLKNLRYTRQVWQETMRVRAFGFTPRLASSDMILNGYHVASQTTLLLPLFLIHHDPLLYPYPNRFDPEHLNPESTAKHPTFAFQPFGFAGNRKCLGSRFVNAESLTLVATLIRQFEVKLASEKDPGFSKDIIAVPNEIIKVTVSLRS